MSAWEKLKQRQYEEGVRGADKPVVSSYVYNPKESSVLNKLHKAQAERELQIDMQQRRQAAEQEARDRAASALRGASTSEFYRYDRAASNPAPFNYATTPAEQQALNGMRVSDLYRYDRAQTALQQAATPLPQPIPSPSVPASTPSPTTGNDALRAAAYSTSHPEVSNFYHLDRADMALRSFDKPNPAVDLKNRPIIDADTMRAAGYDEFVGGYASLYSSSFEINGKEYLFTPIRPDGSIIPKGKLEDYVWDKMDKGKRPEDLDIFLGKFDRYEGADDYGEKLHNYSADYNEIIWSDWYKNLSERVSGAPASKAAAAPSLSRDEAQRARDLALEQLRRTKQYANLASYGANENDPKFSKYAAAGTEIDQRNQQENARADEISKWASALDPTQMQSATDVTGRDTALRQYMTQEEVNIYRYLLGKSGAQAAQKYLNDLEYDLNRREAQATTGEMQSLAQTHPVLANALSVPMTVLKPEGALYSLAQSIAGEPIDTNDPAFSASRMQEAIRGQSASDIQTGIGGTGGEVVSSLYNFGMSFLDSMTAAAVTGGAAGAGALMGANAAADVTKSAVQRGATGQQAITAGGLTGLVTGVLWSVGVKNLLNIATKSGELSIIRSALNQAGVQASQQAINELANIIVDNVTMQDLSNYSLSVDAYVRQGMSQADAERKATEDVAKNVGLAFASGGAMGFVAGAGAAAYSRARASSAWQKIAPDFGVGAEEAPAAAAGIGGESAPVENPLAVAAREMATNAEPRTVANKPVATAPASIHKGTDVQTPALRFEGAEGNVRLRTPSGVVPVEEASFPDERTARLYTHATEYDAQTANKFIDAYGGGGVDGYAQGFKSMYTSGRRDTPYRDALTSLYAQQYLSEDARTTAYAAGMNAAKPAVKAQVEAKPAAEPIEEQAGEILGKAAPQGGLIRQDTAENLSPENQAQLDVLDELGKKYGLSIKTADKLARPDGVSVNGSYNKETREITIAMDAMEDAYLFTGIHEMTHHIQGQVPEEYSILEDFVLDKLKSSPDFGEDALEKRINTYIDAGFDRQGAIDEIVADTIPSVLSDEETVRRLVNEHRTLAERIRDFLKKFVDNLKEIIQRVSKRGRKETVALQNDTDALRQIYDMFDTAMQDAADSPSTGIELSSPEKYSPKARDVIEGYMEAVDEKIVSMHDAAVQDKNKWMPSYEFQEVSDKEAEQILSLTGVDTAGFSHAIDKIALLHIERRHGENGSQDKTMRDVNDVGRIPFVIENSDNITRAVKQNGELVFSTRYKNKDGSLSPVIRYEKRVDGVFCVVEAVPDTDAKLLYVESAYMKKGGSQVPDATGASRITSEIEPGSAPSTSIIPAQGENSNNSNEKFSLKDVEPVNQNELDRLQDENTGLRAAADELRNQFQRVPVTDISAATVNKIASNLLREYNSDYDKAMLAENLASIYDVMAHVPNFSWDELTSMGVGLANQVLEKSRNVDTEMYDRYSDLRARFRENGISLTEKQKQEAASLFDGYQNFRRKLWGRVKVTNDPHTLLDGNWEELSTQYPELFPADANEGDQVRYLLDAMDAIKRHPINPYGYNSEAYAYDVFLSMFKAYYQEQGQKAEALSSAINRARTQAKNAYEKRLLQVKVNYREQRRELAQKFQKSLEDQKMLAAMVAGRVKNEAEKKQLTALKAQAEKYRAQYLKLSSSNNDKLVAQKAYYQERNRVSLAKQRERAQMGKYRSRIESNAKDLYAWLMHPTDKQHVPEALRKPVADFLATLDFSGDRTSKRAELWRERMIGVKDVAARLTENEYEDFYADIDPDFVTRLEEFIGASTDIRTVADLSADQLKELDYLVGIVRKAVKEANRLKANADYQEVAAVGRATMNELATRKEMNLNNGKTLAYNFANFDQEDSFSYFDDIGKAGTTIFRALRKGFDKKVRHIEEAVNFMQRALKGADIRERSNTPVEFQTSGGKLKLTQAQAMELYVQSKREQARGHIFGGGVRPSDVTIKWKKEGKRKLTLRSTSPVTLDEADVERIIKTLTPEQVRVADAMQAFLSNEAAEWGNEASMDLYGYRKFTEENYWPIKSDEYYLTTNEPHKGVDLNAIRNLGMTKATLKGANNPLVLNDIFDTFTRHIDEMATYGGMVVPLSDAMKWYNFRLRGENNEYLGSVKQSIGRVMGKAGNAYFTNFMKDLNGLDRGAYGTEIADLLIRNTKVAAVGFNARVILQQPTAYLRAGLMVNPKYLAAAVFSKPQAEMAKKYSAIARWKSWGFYELNISRSIRDIITGDETTLTAIRELSMKGAQLADEITWGALWNAVSEETRDLHPELTGEAFNEAVGERLSDVIDRTQVVDTTFHRSQMARSRDFSVKVASAFMSEPNKSYNMLRSALVDAKRNNTKASREHAFRAFLAFLLSSLATSAAASVADAFRDDKDKDEQEKVRTWWDKYVSYIWPNLVDTANPLALIPYGKDVWSMIQGYSPTRMELAGIDALFNSATAWIKHFTGEGKASLYKLISDTVKAASKVFGFPAGSILREAEALYNTISPDNIDMKSDTATLERTYQTMYKAIVGKDMKRAEELRQKLLNGSLGYNARGQDDIDRGLRDAMMDLDPRIAAAAKARQAGDLITYENTVKAIKNEGWKQDIAIGAINNYITKYLTAKKEEPAGEYAESLYKTSDFVDAFDRGDAEDMDRIKKYLLANGKDASDIRAQVSKKYKPVYVAFVRNGDWKSADALAQKLYRLGLGYDAGDLVEWRKQE